MADLTTLQEDVTRRSDPSEAVPHLKQTIERQLAQSYAQHLQHVILQDKTFQREQAEQRLLFMMGPLMNIYSPPEFCVFFRLVLLAGETVTLPRGWLCGNLHGQMIRDSR